MTFRAPVVPPRRFDGGEFHEKNCAGPLLSGKNRLPQLVDNHLVSADASCKTSIQSAISSQRSPTGSVPTAAPSGSGDIGQPLGESQQVYVAVTRTPMSGASCIDFGRARVHDAPLSRVMTVLERGSV